MERVDTVTGKRVDTVSWERVNTGFGIESIPDLWTAAPNPGVDAILASTLATGGPGQRCRFPVEWALASQTGPPEFGRSRRVNAESGRKHILFEDL